LLGRSLDLGVARRQLLALRLASQLAWLATMKEWTPTLASALRRLFVDQSSRDLRVSSSYLGDVLRRGTCFFRADLYMGESIGVAAGLLLPPNVVEVAGRLAHLS
jgi:hypothetical protein